MRLLLDNNLSHRLVELLIGHDVEHLRSLGLQAATDDVVLARASEEHRVLVSADTDFGRILATTHATEPSVVLIRRQMGRSVDALAELLLANLPSVADDLAAGAVVVIADEDIRIRRLPILPGS
jgi:predicted nuclease of predicted toxin-antitoxin system